MMQDHTKVLVNKSDLQETKERLIEAAMSIHIMQGLFLDFESKEENQNTEISKKETNKKLGKNEIVICSIFIITLIALMFFAFKISPIFFIPAFLITFFFNAWALKNQKKKIKRKFKLFT